MPVWLSRPPYRMHACVELSLYMRIQYAKYVWILVIHIPSYSQAGMQTQQNENAKNPEMDYAQWRKHTAACLREEGVPMDCAPWTNNLGRNPGWPARVKALTNMACILQWDRMAKTMAKAGQGKPSKADVVNNLFADLSQAVPRVPESYGLTCCTRIAWR